MELHHWPTHPEGERTVLIDATPYNVADQPDGAEGDDRGGDRDNPPWRGVGAAVTRTPGSTNSGTQLESIRLGAQSGLKDRGGRIGIMRRSWC